MRTAKDIMVTDVIAVRPDTSVTSAAGILLQNRVSGMPVTDDDGMLVGVVSEFALLTLVYETGAAQERVGNHMTTDLITISEGVSLTVIADTFISQRVRRLPVVRDGKLVGQISRRDVLRAAQDGLLPNPKPIAAGCSQAPPRWDVKYRRP